MTELLERSEADLGENGAERASPPAEPPVALEPDPRAIACMFAADLEVETLAVPGQANCWVKLLPMDGESHAQWLQGSQPGSDGKIELARAQMELMLATVTDYQFARVKRALNAPEERVTELTRPPGNVKRDSEHWKAFTRGIFRQFTTEMRTWLFTECTRVNGLAPAQQGN